MINGMSFCRRIIDCVYEHDFIKSYYYNKFDYKIVEIEAYGDVKKVRKNHFVTNKLKILREISSVEIESFIRNIGQECYGKGNNGSNNVGNENMGDYNHGNYNLGSYNIGSENIGDWNEGCHNYGNCNIGDCNRGSYNIGHCNMGDFNMVSHQNGCFNTKGSEPGEFMMFNKRAHVTYDGWMRSCARETLLRMPKSIEWIPLDDMQKKDRLLSLTCTTVKGALKSVEDLNKRRQTWWDTLSEKDRYYIRELSNFDQEIFEKCTGIKVS